MSALGTTRDQVEEAAAARQKALAEDPEFRRFAEELERMAGHGATESLLKFARFGFVNLHRHLR